MTLVTERLWRENGYGRKVIKGTQTQTHQYQKFQQCLSLLPLKENKQNKTEELK